MTNADRYAAFRAGEVYEGFEILGVLGRGAMSYVYRARDEEGRVGALKIEQPVVSQRDDLSKRFTLEGKIGMLPDDVLDHTNVIRVYKQGSFSDGRQYQFQEVIENCVNFDKIKGQMSPRDVVHVLYQTMRGLHACHKAGIIHRDLKPGNILSGDNGLKLTDFGIASSQLDDAGDMTQTISLMGTPGYMSPEQTTSAKGLGPESDLYSLGSVGFALQTGAQPYSGRDQWVVMQNLRDTHPWSVNQWVGRGYVKQLRGYEENAEQEAVFPAFVRGMLEAERLRNPPSKPPVTKNPIEMFKLPFVNPWYDWILSLCRQKDRDRRLHDIPALELLQSLDELAEQKDGFLIYSGAPVRNESLLGFIEKIHNEPEDTPQLKLNKEIRLADIYELAAHVMPMPGYESLEESACQRKVLFEKALMHLGKAGEVMVLPGVDKARLYEPKDSLESIMRKFSLPYAPVGRGVLSPEEFMREKKHALAAYRDQEIESIVDVLRVRLDILDQMRSNGRMDSERYQKLFDVAYGDLAHVDVEDVETVDNWPGKDPNSDSTSVLEKKMKRRATIKSRLEQGRYDQPLSSSASRTSTTIVALKNEQVVLEDRLESFEDIVELGKIPKRGRIARLQQELEEKLDGEGLPTMFVDDMRGYKERLQAVGRKAAELAAEEVRQYLDGLTECESLKDAVPLLTKAQGALSESVDAMFWEPKRYESLYNEFVEMFQMVIPEQYSRPVSQVLEGARQFRSATETQSDEVLSSAREQIDEGLAQLDSLHVDTTMARQYVTKFEGGMATVAELTRYIVAPVIDMAKDGTIAVSEDTLSDDGFDVHKTTMAVPPPDEPGDDFDVESLNDDDE